MKIMTGKARVFPGEKAQVPGQKVSETPSPEGGHKRNLAVGLNYGRSPEAKIKTGTNFFKPPPEQH
jgi:hypothetical protein